MLEVQNGRKSVFVRAAVPEMLLDVLQPGSDRQAGGMETLFIDVDMNLFLERVGK